MKLLLWLTITFGSLGLFAPRNATVLVVLVVCALSVASAVFLILELDGPFDGLISVSADPLRYALAHLAAFGWLRGWIPLTPSAGDDPYTKPCVR